MSDPWQQVYNPHQLPAFSPAAWQVDEKYWSHDVAWDDSRQAEATAAIEAANPPAAESPTHPALSDGGGGGIKVTSIAPTSGTVIPATTVTLTGTGFVYDDGFGNPPGSIAGFQFIQGAFKMGGWSLLSMDPTSTSCMLPSNLLMTSGTPGAWEIGLCDTNENLVSNTMPFTVTG